MYKSFKSFIVHLILLDFDSIVVLNIYIVCMYIYYYYFFFLLKKALMEKYLEI